MRHSTTYCLGLLSVLAASQSAPTQQPATPARPPQKATVYPYTLPPVDHTAQYPALRAFVEQVQAACAAHQQARLLALVDKKVVVSWGGGEVGKADFLRSFLHEGYPGSGYDKLQRALRLGGTVRRETGGRLVALYPYVHDDKLYTRTVRRAVQALDPFQNYVGIVPTVVVYRRPSRASTQLAWLRYPVLYSVNYATPTNGWLPIEAVDHSFRGYVRASQLYCQADMRLTIEQRAGGFRITCVAPYD